MACIRLLSDLGLDSSEASSASGRSGKSGASWSSEPRHVSDGKIKGSEIRVCMKYMEYHGVYMRIFDAMQCGPTCDL